MDGVTGEGRCSLRLRWLTVQTDLGRVDEMSSAIDTAMNLSAASACGFQPTYQVGVRSGPQRGRRRGPQVRHPK